MMESYGVIGILVDRDTDKIAAHVGIDRNTLGRQKLPFKGKRPTVLGTINDHRATGIRNDLERLAEQMLFVRDDLEAGPERYAVPVFWLAQLIKYVCIPMPEQAPTINDLHAAMTRLMKEAGDVAGAHADALADDIPDRVEAERISKEIYELVQMAVAYNIAFCRAAGIPVPGVDL